MEELKEALAQFVAERDWDQCHTPKNLSMALVVEVAELVEHFQWLSEQESLELSEASRQEVASEIGDVLIYLTLVAMKLGIDPVRAAVDKLEQNKKRFPAPGSRSEESSIRKGKV